ncbi:glycoside-pentoside-hexuronide (GPH):cation symporter [Treponema phagedenis]|uniref:glycoside-pentoside-hexuronide (GPH):cation symporter n=1 Tax=Treponema phagedenis TaxID=162 RepID=UPI0001F63AC9|nr:glycoside-pentoside-hexuronide (GPH):cation symporter [Treponema phagedenis]EFW38823.1 transporter, major facilitator family protein [Treponema phagedenis F0421]TYT76535.1 sugar transporter [Treponema phagedenis]TYT77728.1 sugar transporter [Treponema phagedenis]
MRNEDLSTRAYAFGTFGRDMVFALVSMYLLYYLTDVVNITKETLAWVSLIMVSCRIFDALNDPIMGVIVDNTETGYGKFKPWILGGMIFSALFTVLLFTDFGLQGKKFLLSFAVLYLCWGLSYTAHDISYWSMLPALTQDQKKRGKIGSFAKICATLGLFSVVISIIPITNYLAERFSSKTQAFHIYAFAVVLCMLLCLTPTLLFTVEDKTIQKTKPSTPLNELFSVIVKNDQLLWITISMVLFTIGYTTTSSFGIYYCKYLYGNENAYSLFALVLGISQIASLAAFPILSKKHKRSGIYQLAIVLVICGYFLMYFSEFLLILIAIAGCFIFFGSGLIQILMLMFIADTVEYGQLKLGRRNNSITLSLQPLIYKTGGAVASGIVGATLIFCGIQEQGFEIMSPAQITLFKIAMLVFPLSCIIFGYFIYTKKYIIDEKKYAEILANLNKDNSDSAPSK